MLVSFKSYYVENVKSDYLPQLTLELDDSSHPNNIESTFGFHTRKTFPERNRTVTRIINKDLSENEIEKKVQRILTEYSESSEDSQSYGRSDTIALNGLNVIGYIPVLGLIPCAARLIHPLFNKESAMHYEPKDVKTAHYIRGFIEGLGLGSLYVIPDSIITVKRFCVDSNVPEGKLLISDKV